MGGLHVFVTGTLVATRIVPEPSTLVLAFAAFAGLLAVGAASGGPRHREPLFRTTTDFDRRPCDS